jgi:hypothetical protein
VCGGTPDSLRREAHNGRSRAVAPDSLGKGRIQWSTATDPTGRLTWPGHRTVNGACSVCTELFGASIDKKLLLLSNDYNFGGGYKYPQPAI